ncbi:phosphoribosylamine--glycine ligase [Alteriqipengyuania lutimaris]|uniref:Phosphoribosylamine--glycine ligase n=1 Tax=Alteriqipengyuania lutimaris TaxID=1538146 RepID=A0A395LIR8_9SPHN|nr:phosphoribosylamine--glycine ligase [Alteriqipengyuania lutimaris]MBB3034274.1 phosphoribosylamine--glycine ligase [Alteriqipengyuania lutimaris]RDS76818.1 phosphoribosylamine--glycine ligase [Alteriqipengyuania lutimaris]
MNILLVGSGGREHALAWKLAAAPSCSRLYATPGNPGIAEQADIVALDAGDHKAVIGFCHEKDIALVVIGPEAPLVAGLADDLRAEGIAVFGPSKAAAQLEGSKGFTKDLCARADIPTARYERATSLEAAWGALKHFDAPFVLKADGLAAGKGVVIAETREEAQQALSEMFDGRFGSAGSEVVIEEFMAGEEASFFALTDGEIIVPFGTAQDHKRVGEGDTGPNTGGMGAYSPAPVLSEDLIDRAMREIVAPTVRTLGSEGMPYVGVLYAGLMLTEQGPKLVEYNIRFGDPECQVLMMRFEGDLAALLMACATGKLASAGPVRFSHDTALTVVMAAEGYPGTPKKGGTIDLGSAESEDAKVFHAGTARTEDGTLVSSGGRVLNVTARGANVTQAQAAAYQAVDAITFPDGFCRRDIGWREMERERG